MPADGKRNNDRPEMSGLDWAHWSGFLISGILAFATDAAVLAIGIRFFSLDPLVARIIAIGTAMLVGWLAHRRFTFRVAASPSLAEFARFAASAWAAAILNYAVFALVLLVIPATAPLHAMTISSVATMVFSYISMRYAVFRKQAER